MPRMLQNALLVLSGIIATLAVQLGTPTVGMLLYGTDFRAAYTDCETAKVDAARLNPSDVAARTYESFRKTVLVDEFRCLDSQALYDRLRQFRVSDVTINEIEMEAKLKDSDVAQ